MSRIHSENMIARHRKMLTTGEYSDMTIVCDGEKLRVHRFIMCSASRFFEVAAGDKYIVNKIPQPLLLDSCSLEVTDQEAETGVICLVEDKLEAFKRMLSYLYTLDYDDQDGVNPFNMAEPVCAEDPPPEPSEQGDSESDSEGDGSYYRRRAALFARRAGRRSPSIATWRARHEERGFWSDRESDFERSDFDERDSEFDTAASETNDETQDEIRERAHLRRLNNVNVYTIADKYNLPELKELAVEKFRRDSGQCRLKDLAATAHEVYMSTPSGDRGLRDVVIQMCETHIDQIMEDEDVGTVMEAIAGFGSDMFKAAMRTKKKETEDLESKIRTKKERIRSLIKKKRDFSSKLRNKEEIVKLLEIQFHKVWSANDFATGLVKNVFGMSKSKLQKWSGPKYLTCEYCEKFSPGSVRWVGDSVEPYLKLSCWICDGKNESFWRDTCKQKALSLDSLKDLDPAYAGLYENKFIKT